MISWLTHTFQSARFYTITRYSVIVLPGAWYSPSPSTTSNTHADDISSSEAPTPTSSPRKESNNAISSTTTSSNSSGTGNANSTTTTTTTSTTNTNTINRTLTKKQQREIAPCKLLLEQLEQQDEAWPFLLPVNTKQFPTYKKIIKTPMDLSTIKKKLQDTAWVYTHTKNTWICNY